MQAAERLRRCLCIRAYQSDPFAIILRIIEAGIGRIDAC
jgi:hypothetical protein